jgi:hypothetical protein
MTATANARERAREGGPRVRGRGWLASALLIAGASIGCMRVVDAVQKQDCTARPTDPTCAPSSWPPGGTGANSDPWIVAHHDTITQMQPRVLVLNFDNSATVDMVRQTAELQIQAIAEGSRYHGYSDARAPIFLAYQIAKIVDLADHPVPAGWTNPSSTKLPVGPNGSFDPLALFSSRFSDLYVFPDPATPTRNLSLCELFEKGVINEVWIQDHESGIRHAPFNVERKQIYDLQNNAVPGSFSSCVGGGGCLQDVNCAVTVRMAHLDPNRGPGCDLYVRGWGVEGMWDALPAFAPAAKTFLNRDFRTRFGVAFDGWENICDQTGTDLCVSYPTSTSATGTYTNGIVWKIDPFIQGCGSTVFPPNARQRYDFKVATPVQSRCELFGLGQSGSGTDELEPYTAAKVAADEQAFPDCGGGWQIYWRQSIPGLGNQAKSPDGHPLRNWWPLLFY